MRVSAGRAKMPEHSGKRVLEMVPKKFRLSGMLVLLVAVVSFASLSFSRHGRPAPQNHAAAPSQAQADVPAARELPPGTIAYRPTAAIAASTVARKHLAQSSYMT